MKEQKDPINPTYYDEIFDKMMDNKFTKEQLLVVDEFNVFKYIYTDGKIKMEFKT